jgi:hypothetical protein
VEAEWTDGEQITGSNNWTTAGSLNIPAQWTGTLTGANPGFTDLASNDPRPAPGSPLLNAANPRPATPATFPFPHPHFPPAHHPPRHAIESAPATRPFDCDLDIGAYERPPLVPSVWPLKWSSASGLSWLPTPGATSYDVVRGELSMLLSTMGSFSMSLDQCLENDGADSAASDSEIPPAGDGFFYLVRSTPGGTYDSACAGQSAPRDASIQASPFACP